MMMYFLRTLVTPSDLKTVEICASTIASEAYLIEVEEVSLHLFQSTQG